MKNITVKGLLIIVFGLTLFFSGFAIIVSAQGPGPSVRGNATALNPFGDPITASFNVWEDSDGYAFGQWESHRPLPTNDNVRVHASLNCLYFIDDMTASIGGVFTHSNSDNPLYAIGEEFIFIVIDNGQGNNAPPDIVSFILLGSGSDCTDEDNIDAADDNLTEVIRGNIQVNP